MDMALDQLNHIIDTTFSRLMFNAQRYMHVSDAYFSPSKIRFPYELKEIFDRILHELQYLDNYHVQLLLLLYKKL